MTAIVVGAGILGLAHAYAFARRGFRVIVTERYPFASGATVRNFGMVWPIGQPLGDRRELALASREHWLTVVRESGMWHRECGSLHLAYHDDEAAVIEEFLAGAGGETGQWLDAAGVLARSPSVRTTGTGGDLKGGLWSPWELAVDPRTAAADVARYLHDRYAVEFRWGTAALTAATENGGAIVALPDETLRADYVVVCPGTEPGQIFGDQLRAAGMQLSRLQMLRAETEINLGTHLCAGLTLLHYGNFASLNGLAAVRERLGREWPGYAENGIHLLVSQHADGTLTIGDTHHYADHFPPYGDTRLDDMVLRYLDTFLPVDEIRVVQHWDGVYGKHPTEPYVSLPVGDRVRIVGSAGGAGMTLSFGIGEREISRWIDER
jgi:FAD dependent oxidoreductase TIGR03364